METIKDLEQEVRNLLGKIKSLWSENRPFGENRELFGELERVVEKRSSALQKANQRLREEIAERRKTEDALRKNEKRYREYFENDLSGIYVSKPDGRLIDCNPEFVRMFGFSSAEDAKSADMPAIYSDDGARELFLAKIREKGILERHEMEMRNLNGRLIHTIENARGVFDENGELVEIRGYIFDITERRNLESQLMHAMKMEAVGTLAGGIAHDFNNMLMAIQGNVSIMLMDKTIEEKYHKRLKNIERFIRHGAELTHQLLGFAKGGTNELKPTGLNDLIRNSSKMFGRTKKEISVHMMFQEDLRVVDIDRPQIEQVLLNLFLNAWQAMPGGGKLYIETENAILDKGVARMRGINPGEFVKITVTDTGVGMDDKTRNRIFDPFFTTREIGMGTGLGLAAVYSIIKNHGGFVNVSSIMGEGTTFTIYLPASTKTKREETSLNMNTVNGETILFVDDEEIIIDVGREILEALGYHVLIAKSGEDALKTYEENHSGIDLVILDLIMPDMSGGEVYDRMKRINPDIRTLLSSGYSIDGQATEILARGCDGFIQKPFNMKDLSAKIRSILDTGD